MEYNGKALVDITDPKDPTKVLIRGGYQQLPGFARSSRDDGKTACGCWIYSGAWTAAGNQMVTARQRDP